MKRFLIISFILGFFVTLPACSKTKETLIRVTRGDVYKASRYCNDEGRRGMLFLDHKVVQCVNGETIALDKVHYRN